MDEDHQRRQGVLALGGVEETVGLVVPTGIADRLRLADVRIGQYLAAAGQYLAVGTVAGDGEHRWRPRG